MNDKIKQDHSKGNWALLSVCVTVYYATENVVRNDDPQERKTRL